MDATMSEPTISSMANPVKSPSRGARIRQYWSHVRRNSANPFEVARAIMEMAALRLVNGLAPGDYLLGRLYQKDVPWREKWGYLGTRQYEEFLSYLNDPAYRKISQNKLAEKALLEAVGLPTPRFYGYYSATSGRDSSGRELRSDRDLHRLFTSVLGEHSVCRLCFKELEGWGGSGFRAVEIEEANSEIQIFDLSDRSRKSMSIDEFVCSLDADHEYLIEAYVEQHPNYAEFHPSSINSYRFWVLNEAPGRTVVPFANLRFGRNGALVDNGEDRIMAPLDPETGEVQTGYELTIERREHVHHPDTGTTIYQRTLPYYMEARQLAMDCLAVFPHMNFAGIDIAISKDGPVVLELNNHPGGMGPLIDRKPMRERFNRAISNLGRAA